MTLSGRIIPTTEPAPGWKGGFLKDHCPYMGYPECKLGSLPMLGNMDNVTKLKRKLDALWPEFSWETVLGDPDSRCYRMFAPDISSVGYDDAGRIWSIICPQQAIYSPTLGSLNIEVSVTGQRGWVDETAGPYRDLLAADMSVTVKLWFSPSAKERKLYDVLKSLLDQNGLPFPLDKANAIQVTTHSVGVPVEPFIAVRSGTNPDIPIPAFADHESVAWAAANVTVEIGPIQTLNDAPVDDFNAMIVDIFNLASGNLLQQGNKLYWNVWVDAPTLVDQAEWLAHAEYWRQSLDTGHGSPDGDGTVPRYADGRDFEPIDAIVEEGWDRLKAWLMKNYPLSSALLPDSMPADWGGPPPASEPATQG